jgi:hypothetical protein
MNCVSSEENTQSRQTRTSKQDPMAGLENDPTILVHLELNALSALAHDSHFFHLHHELCWAAALARRTAAIH